MFVIKKFFLLLSFFCNFFSNIENKEEMKNENLIQEFCFLEEEERIQLGILKIIDGLNESIDLLKIDKKYAKDFESIINFNKNFFSCLVSCVCMSMFLTISFINELEFREQSRRIRNLDKIESKRASEIDRYCHNRKKNFWRGVFWSLSIISCFSFFYFYFKGNPKNSNLNFVPAALKVDELGGKFSKLRAKIFDINVCLYILKNIDKFNKDFMFNTFFSSFNLVYLDDLLKKRCNIENIAKEEIDLRISILNLELKKTIKELILIKRELYKCLDDFILNKEKLNN